MFLYSIVLLAFALASQITAQDPSYWNGLAKKNLEKVMNTIKNENKAVNVVLFLGDGMDMSSITAGRILKGQREGKLGEDGVLTFDEFPYIGVSKTYNTDKTVADSAGTATAFLCGVKSKYSTIGVDDGIETGNCSNVHKSRLSCIADWHLQSGKSAGVVTNMRVTHATPAPMYAAAADRWWESDADLPEDAEECDDIAYQLVNRYPGRNLQVILGGGRANFLPETKNDPEYKQIKGNRKDNLNLLDKWKERRREENSTFAYVWNKKQFDDVDINQTDYLLGLFEPSHMKDVTVTEEKSSDRDPTLAEMTEKAIKILRKNKKGFFLLVEGGLIDDFHHDNLAVRAVSEVVEFDKAVKMALELTDTKDTLIVVTADHAQAMSLSGYPSRGDNIFGASSTSNADHMPYTTLLYVTGPGYTGNFTNGRQNITNIDTTSNNYAYQTTVPRSSATHVGEDVVSYAIGPMAHLLSGVYEQNYIAHVMAYASQVGQYNSINSNNLNSSYFTSQNAGNIVNQNRFCVIFAVFSLVFMYRNS